ncbi:MAG TPA: hypothetical protein VG247_17345 [Pseudonocardiaceae bacterium]|nr:hypothetical protein [Pseudonocardiaceae bacterium]
MPAPHWLCLRRIDRLHQRDRINTGLDRCPQPPQLRLGIGQPFIHRVPRAEQPSRLTLRRNKSSNRPIHVARREQLRQPAGDEDVAEHWRAAMWGKKAVHGRQQDRRLRVSEPSMNALGG